MRGQEPGSERLFSYVRLEDRIAKDHPLRAIRALVDEALSLMNDRFEALYSDMGRPSIAPELLLRATLLQAFFSVRSERQLMDQIDYNRTPSASAPGMGGPGMARTYAAANTAPCWRAFQFHGRSSSMRLAGWSGSVART